MKRREFLAAAGATIGTVAMGPAPAGAQTLIERLLQRRNGNVWKDQFDARRTSRGSALGKEPIFSTSTPAYVSQAIGHYRNIVAKGGWPVVPANEKLKLGARSKAVPLLRRRLVITGDLSSTAGRSEVLDSWVEAAVRRFQARHGLPADGVLGRYTFASMNVPASTRLGQLETNLVRLRSMSGYLGDRYIMVNIPAAHIEAVEYGSVASRHTAIVGKVDRQTPILNSKIHEIIFNPYWTSPKSIIRKDIIPLMRKDPEYLTRNKIRIFREDGSEMHPSEVDWNSEEAVDYTLRQEPGKINAMASTKINFHNPHAVYMHDTPQQSLFGQIERFHSSGCVRVQNVRDLVAWILKDTPGWNRSEIERTIASGANTPIPIAEPVPVYFAYVTAWATMDGTVHFRDDIYRRDGVEELVLGTPAAL